MADSSHPATRRDEPFACIETTDNPDAQVTAVRSGIFHGDARLFADDGTLLATSNQSGLAGLPR